MLRSGILVSQILDFPSIINSNQKSVISQFDLLYSAKHYNFTLDFFVLELQVSSANFRDSFREIEISCTWEITPVRFITQKKFTSKHYNLHIITDVINISRSFTRLVTD